MSFFPQALVTSTPDNGFHPLFRLLDDFDAYSRGSAPQQVSHRRNGSSHNQQRHVTKIFTPKFDVKEVNNAYELHGELPGIDQKDVEIEFVDSHTLHVKGRVERSWTSGNTNNSAPGTPSTETAAPIEEGEASHRATVEEATEEAEPSSSTTEGKQVAEAGSKDVAAQPQQDQVRYWVSERSVGEFSRSFTFPVRVDQDNVRASMKNGVLSIVVPKSTRAEGKKIEIS